jgi:hypothetical protein
MTKDYLLSIREVQAVTGPHMCLAASKFLALKLLGFVAPHTHLNDFLHSPWARRFNNPNLLAACWGGSIAKHNAMFNATVLPAVVNDANAGVKATRGQHVRFHRGLTYFYDGAHQADMMLLQRTPLIVAVSIFGGTSQDHWLVVFKDVEGQTWAVDSLPRGNEGVCRLDDDFTFTKPVTVPFLSWELDDTRIPCGRPHWAYFG